MNKLIPSLTSVFNNQQWQTWNYDDNDDKQINQLSVNCYKYSELSKIYSSHLRSLINQQETFSYSATCYKGVECWSRVAYQQYTVWAGFVFVHVQS